MLLKTLRKEISDTIVKYTMKDSWESVVLDYLAEENDFCKAISKIHEWETRKAKVENISVNSATHILNITVSIS